MKLYKELEDLNFFKWLDDTHNLADTDMKPEYLDELPLDDIHRTVCNAMVFRWFRDKHQLIHHMYWVYKKKYDGIDWIFHIKGINMINNNVVPHDETRFETYEEAELECLKKLIELVKNK